MSSNLELSRILIDNQNTIVRSRNGTLYGRTRTAELPAILRFIIPREENLDPKGRYLQRWNKIFLVLCFFALNCDPLFFYIPIINVEKQCIKFDNTLRVIAITLRTSTDLFYVIHIFLKLYIGPGSSSSRLSHTYHPATIDKTYLSSYFIVDILAVLPLPQIVTVTIPYLSRASLLYAKRLLHLVIFLQWVPRIIRIYPLHKELKKTSGLINNSIWGGVFFNLFLYMSASHVLGALWYIFAIDQMIRCWLKACIQGCHQLPFYCNEYDKQHAVDYKFNNSYCTLVDSDHAAFNFGLFDDALRSDVVQSNQFLRKIPYCFWWGLRNLSSCGQNLQTSTYFGDIAFATSICVLGLILLALLIGNIQKYLQMLISTAHRENELRERRQDIEQWMSHRKLPEDMRERIRRYEQYDWQEKRGIDEESIIRNLPRDLRRDIKRHLYLKLLMRVPIFEGMNDQLKDALCDRLKPMLYTKNNNIVCEGDPVNEMLFIMRGSLFTMTTNGGITGFLNSVTLKAGDYCGEELLTWALDPPSHSNLPISTRTVKSMTEVEAFALFPDDLKFVVLQFRRLDSKQLRHTYRYYSQQWKTWAAYFIQVAWRRHYRRKLEKSSLLKNTL
ncbi:unnamed protein product [Amaranthus hypochondriacus]